MSKESRHSAKERLAPSGGCAHCAERLEREAKRLLAEYATAAATTPSFLLDDEHRVKMWQGGYFKQAAEWLRANAHNEKLTCAGESERG